MSAASCPICGLPTRTRRDGTGRVCPACKVYRSNHRHASRADRARAVADARVRLLRALDTLSRASR